MLYSHPLLMLLHVTSVALEKKAALIAGEPGAGKSDLALRLIDAGAALVSDDQTILKSEDGKLFASAPPSIAGFIEVRYIGLLRMSYIERAEVTLYIELAATEGLERLPEQDSVTFLGVKVRKLKLPAFEASTPAKIRAIME